MTTPHKTSKKNKKDHHRVSKHFISTGDMKAPRRYNNGPREEVETEEKYLSRSIQDNSKKYEENQQQESQLQLKEREYQILLSKMEKTQISTSFLNRYEKEWDTQDDYDPIGLNIQQLAADVQFLPISTRLRLDDEHFIDSSFKLGFTTTTSEIVSHEEIDEIPIIKRNDNPVVDVKQDLSFLNKLLGVNNPEIPQVETHHPVQVDVVSKQENLDEWLSGLL